MHAHLVRRLALCVSLMLPAACHGAAHGPPVTPAAPIAQPVHWSYHGAEGPSAWAALSPQYRTCGEGRAQSPIDLTDAQVGASGTWKLEYGATSLRIASHQHVTDILDNGHTLQVTVDEGSSLTTPRGVYALKQFHFHAPSEHTVDGERFPAEVHFLHQSADGALAVVAAFFAEGAENENLAKLLAHLPQPGQALHLPEVGLDLDLHLPANHEAFEYTGSLTTPPCTEQVEWLVFRGPLHASPEQLKVLAEHMAPNNRPLQERHGRAIGLGEVSGRTARSDRN